VELLSLYVLINRVVNNRTGQPYGTEEAIAKCHPNGTRVHGREFNPNEIEQLQKFVLNHADHHHTEPPVTWQLPGVATIGFNTSVPVMCIQRILLDQK
jgi:hypothetical protein